MLFSHSIVINGKKRMETNQFLSEVSAIARSQKMVHTEVTKISDKINNIQRDACVATVKLDKIIGKLNEVTLIPQQHVQSNSDRDVAGISATETIAEILERQKDQQKKVDQIIKDMSVMTNIQREHK